MNDVEIVEMVRIVQMVRMVEMDRDVARIAHFPPGKVRVHSKSFRGTSLAFKYLGCENVMSV